MRSPHREIMCKADSAAKFQLLKDLTKSSERQNALQHPDPRVSLKSR